MNEYQKRVEEFRTHYYTKYDVKLDNEIIYFFIRVNEMQSDLKNQIADIPKLTYKTGWDYFLYGLGKFTIPAILVSIGLIIILFFSSRQLSQNNIIIKNGAPFLIMKQNDSIYYLPLKNNL